MDNSFYGWYMKCQSDKQTLAVIPAIHRGEGKSSCSIQIITDDGTWRVEYPVRKFWQRGRKISIEKNRFSSEGIVLDVNTQGLRAGGRIEFGKLRPLRYGIMGPAGLVPFMECRHSVWSMRHTVRGRVCINGQEFLFVDGTGYWEGDRGRSFPREYVWTQCCFSQGSLMLAIADVPMAAIHLTGVIAVVVWKGREYRLATYLGARVVLNTQGIIRIVQGELELEARLLETLSQPLRAPIKGNMERTVHECIACHAFYRLKKRGRTLLAFESSRASFEYEYPFVDYGIKSEKIAQ